MSDETFTHDVFLNHNAKDKAAVRAVAERLRKDGLKVWFDEWELPTRKAQSGRVYPNFILQHLAFSLCSNTGWSISHSDFGFRISDLRSPACRRMRSARTGRSCG